MAAVMQSLLGMPAMPTPKVMFRVSCLLAEHIKQFWQRLRGGLSLDVRIVTDICGYTMHLLSSDTAALMRRMHA